MDADEAPRGGDQGNAGDPGGWEQLLQLYLGELAAAQGEHKARLLYAIGRLQEERLGRPRDALRSYEEALRGAPTYHPPRRAAKRLYREGGQPDLVAELLAGEAAAATTTLERAQVLWEQGQLFESLGRREAALASYRGALAAEPAFAPALAALQPLLAARGGWAELAEVVAAAIPGCVDMVERAALYSLLGRLREVYLDDLEGAWEAFDEAVALNPQEVEALAALERLCRRLHRWSDLARTLELEAALSESGPSSASTLLEVARIRQDLLGDPGQAQVALEEALSLDPHHRPSLEALAGLLGVAGRQERLAEILGRWAEVETEPRERADLYYRRSQLLLRLGRQAEALEALHQSHHAYPHHRPTLQALGELLRRAHDWSGLAAMQLEEARSLEDPDQRALALLRTAEVFARRLGDDLTAVAVLREAVATGPGRLAAIRELSRLLGRLERWTEQAELLAREAERSPDPEQASEHLRELARVREERLADPAGAAQALEQALRLDPDERPVLEKLVQLYRELGCGEDLIRVLLLLAERVEDQRAVVALFGEAGRVAEETLGDGGRAHELYSRALQLNPGYVPALQACGRLLADAGRWEELREMHRRSLEVAITDDERADLHTRLAQLSSGPLARPEEARQHLREVLRWRPGDLTALKLLEAAASESGNREELAENLQLQAAAAQEPATAALLLCRRGAVLEGLPDGEDAALEAYQQASAQDPTFLPAYRSLVRLHGAAGRWPEVAAVLGQMLAVEQDPAQRVLLLMRLATVQRDQLQRPDQAQEAYAKVLQLDPGHPSALRALEELYRRTGDPLLLVPVLETRARVTDNPLVAGACYLEIDRIGPLATVQIRSPEAVPARAMKQQPWSRAGLERLELVIKGKVEASSLADLYGRAVQHFDDEPTREDLAARRAELLERAGRLEEARDAYRQALQERPAELPLLKGLQRVLGRLGDQQGLLHAIAQEGQITLAPERMVPELLAAGEAWLALGESEQARRVVELALRRCPDSLPALLRYESLLEDAGALEKLYPLLEELLPRVNLPASRHEIYLRLADRQARQGDPAAARGHLVAALTALPDSLRAHHAHAQVLDELGAAAEAADEWETVLAHPEATAAWQREARLALGRLWGLSLGQGRRGIDVLHEVLGEEGTDQEALLLLAEVYASERLFVEMAEVLQRRYELAPPEQRVGILLEWARIEEEERGDRARAYELLLEARRADPIAEEPVREIGRILWEDGAFDILRTLLLEYADGLGGRDVGRAVPFLTQLGREYAQAFETIGDAVALLGRVLEIDPGLLDVRHDLAELYSRQSATVPLAIEQHLAILAVDPLRLDSLLPLFSLFERTRADHDRAFALGGVLEYLGVLDSADLLGMQAYRGHSMKDARRGLSPAERESLLLYPEEGGALAKWLALVAERLADLFPVNLKQRGVLKAHRLPGSGSDSVYNYCMRLADSFGARKFSIYKLPVADRPLEVASTDPPSLLLLGSALEGWSLPQRRFHLARAISSFANGLHVIAALGEQTTAALVAASVLLEEEDLELEGLDERLVERCAETLHDHLPDRRKRSLAQLGRLVLGGPASLPEQVRRATFSMNRAGLLFAGDVHVVLGELVGPASPALPLEDRLARLQQSPAALDLISWLLTEQYARLRLDLSLAVE